MQRKENTMTRKRIFTVVLLLSLILVVGATHAAMRFAPLVSDRDNRPDDYLVKVSHQLHETIIQAPNRHRFTLRFLVDSPLRPPNTTLEWVDGSPDDVLCFEGIMQHPSDDYLILGEAIGCAKIVTQHPLEEGDAILGLNVRHIIQLIGGNIVDDDLAIVVPLLDSPTSLYTHGLTATTDINNIRPELNTGFYQGKDGIVGVNGNMNLSQFPDRILFNALFTIEFTDSN
jgi:hypothetical protein